jgi:hypothetical protein
VSAPLVKVTSRSTGGAATGDAAGVAARRETLLRQLAELA